MLRLTKERILWVDSIKAVGMFLVFYDHIAERVAAAGSAIAFYQLKFDHAFLMPVFFIISGFFFKPHGNFNDNFKKLFLRRLLPVFVFGLLFIPLWITYFYMKFGFVDWYQIIVKILYYLKGSPQLNLITWFLVCLFTCEILASFIIPKIKSRTRSLFWGILILVTGLLVCRYHLSIAKLTGVTLNTWYIHEAIVAMGFYFTGFSIFPFIKKIAATKKWMVYLLLPIFFFIAFFTFNLNSPTEDFTVLMVLSQHGYIIPFLITAFAGAFFLISLCIILPFNSLFEYIGKNTLYLLGLNGIFHHFINGEIVDLYAPPDSVVWTSLYCSVIVLLSMLLCAPIITILDKNIPQLFGKTSKEGPFLPNLEKFKWRDKVREANKIYVKNKLLKKEN
ncbi:acyltransferase [Zunongwangia sp. F363]|uniref:Acyltransferase n=1 Tax=Autumnicola tepida TaxID=3075595 RepID=A0ABU3CDH2_9FLAO|nr:acyltransferase [Zunongwangia sp. F363]MDT0644292.1 acyltransferase [Zunongwangia sp. F363]